MARTDGFCNRAEAAEAHDDIPLSPRAAETIGDVIARRYSRRDMMRGTLGVAAAASLFGPSAFLAGIARAEAAPAIADFEEIAAGIDATHHLAPGYRAEILLRWGDPLFPDSPPFDPLKQSAAAQLKQFGYNNDYIAFLPLDRSATSALLCVNHEYTNEEVMFPGVGRQDLSGFAKMTRGLTDVEMAAHGVTIVEIAHEGDAWRPVLDSRYNRRITPLDTMIGVDGPAAGNDLLKTSADRTGTRILGTLNNCAGGLTPWGTYLTAEENFHYYFWTDRRDADGKPLPGLGGDQAKSYERYGVPTTFQGWGRFHDRFNVDKEPNEPNRFGWIVEIDPLDPHSMPVKHTALGRYRHEGAETLINKDGRVVIYSGDDARFDYVYRFVSAGRYDAGNRAANMKLLSEGTLSVAKFNEDGRVTWLPLDLGNAKITDAGFRSQADILINARLAADAAGATAMDRPEDVQPNPVNGRVYVMLTNNKDRKPERIDAADPRPENYFGHIIEMTPPDGDHAADVFTWEILVRCGDPSIASVGALWNPATSANGWFASPDNATVDSKGRLWIATDQGEHWPKTGRADGLYALSTDGEQRRTSKLFFRVPVGAELCGPCFTPDDESLFVSVQHPGTDGTTDFKGFEREFDLRGPGHALAGFRSGHAAAPLGGGHHQDRRRQNRLGPRDFMPAKAGMK